MPKVTDNPGNDPPVTDAVDNPDISAPPDQGQPPAEAMTIDLTDDSPGGQPVKDKPAGEDIDLNPNPDDAIFDAETEEDTPMEVATGSQAGKPPQVTHNYVLTVSNYVVASQTSATPAARSETAPAESRGELFPPAVAGPSGTAGTARSSAKKTERTGQFLLRKNLRMSSSLLHVF